MLLSTTDTPTPYGASLASPQENGAIFNNSTKANPRQSYNRQAAHVFFHNCYIKLNKIVTDLDLNLNTLDYKFMVMLISANAFLDMNLMKNQKITWNATGLWTMLTFFLSVLAGIGLMRQKIVLSPPIASYTIYFYLAVVLFPSLATFIICVRRHPVGQQTMLVVLPVFVSVMICFYLTLLSPAFYDDIQCQTGEHTRLIVRLDCQCEHAPSGSTVQEPCVAEQWWPIPLMRLVK